jgi:hypothetical protein
MLVAAKLFVIRRHSSAGFPEEVAENKNNNSLLVVV